MVGVIGMYVYNTKLEKQIEFSQQVECANLAKKFMKEYANDYIVYTFKRSNFYKSRCYAHLEMNLQSDYTKYSQFIYELPSEEIISRVLLDLGEEGGEEYNSIRLNEQLEFDKKLKELFL